MMELTRKGEYAVRGIIHLARKPFGSVVLLSDIAEEADIPQTFLAKIFQNFAKLGFIKSYRGTGGGFSLARSASTITLRQVVEAVEGPIAPNRCVPEPGDCERSASCAVHAVWHRVQLQTVEILDGVSIEELAREVS